MTAEEATALMGQVEAQTAEVAQLAAHVEERLTQLDAALRTVGGGLSVPLGGDLPSAPGTGPRAEKRRLLPAWGLLS